MHTEKSRSYNGWLNHVANLELPHSLSSQPLQVWGKCTSTLRCCPVGWPDQLPAPGITEECPQPASAARTAGERLLRREEVCGIQLANEHLNLIPWAKTIQRRSRCLVLSDFFYPTAAEYLTILITAKQIQLLFTDRLYSTYMHNISNCVPKHLSSSCIDTHCWAHTVY